MVAYAAPKKQQVADEALSRTCSIEDEDGADKHPGERQRQTARIHEHILTFALHFPTHRTALLESRARAQDVLLIIQRHQLLKHLLLAYLHHARSAHRCVGSTRLQVHRLA